MNDLIKNLREQTGAGILDVKQALDEAKGDKKKAVEILRKKGAVKMGKKADRAAKEGLVEAYIHPGGKLGVLLELNCETDFVARTEDFQRLARELALHIAASNPLYVSKDEVPGEVVEKEKEIFKESASAPSVAKATAGKKATADKQLSDEILNKVLEGKINKYFEEVCLLEQPYVKNPDIKIKQVIADAAAKMGENIQIRRFVRFMLGN